MLRQRTSGGVRRFGMLAALAALIAFALVGAWGSAPQSASAGPPVEADATAVTQWNLIAVSTITGVPGPGLPGAAGGAPPASQINMGMVQGAVYDAVNAITPKHHRPYLLNRRFGNTASDEAAVATAAYLVLKNIVETVPQSITFPNRATLLASLASQYDAAKNAIPDSPFKNQGIAAGTAAAEAMIDARQDDGRFGPSPFVFPCWLSAPTSAVLRSNWASRDKIVHYPQKTGCRVLNFSGLQDIWFTSAIEK